MNENGKKKCHSIALQKQIHVIVLRNVSQNIQRDNIY